MDRKYAKAISDLLAGVSHVSGSKYTLKKRHQGKSLSGFHQWADGKPLEGAFLLADQAGDCLWVLLLDWQGRDNYYVVLYPESKSGPMAEIHRLALNAGEANLNWRYTPTKRDGRNEERKAYFCEAFLSVDVNISVPKVAEDVDDFIGELFQLAAAREKADTLDPVRPNPRIGFPEGKLKEKLHLSRERNSAVVQQAKLIAMKRDGFLKCACCGFDYFATYGEVGKGFIEAHHIRPLSQIHEDGEETKVEDLALVCANCHRMLHRKRPWVEMNQLSTALKKRT